MSPRKRMPSYRLWGSTEDGVIEFESLTNDTLEGALNVIRQSFFVDESVCKAVNLMSEPGAAKELEELCLDAAKDGVSVVAVNVSTSEVVGVAFNKIQILSTDDGESYFEVFSKNCKYKSSKSLADFMINVDSRVNLFTHYNVNCILECMFLATLSNYSQRRIGELLVSTTIEVGKELMRGKKVKTPIVIDNENVIHNELAIPSLVSAIMTSRYSQKISSKVGLEKLAEVNYDEFEFAGKKFSERIGSAHPTTILVAKRL